MQIKLFFVASLLLISAQARGAGDGFDKDGNFHVTKDTRMYMSTAGEPTLKNGKRPFVSFIFPAGFYTDGCSSVRRNSVGELRCSANESEFFLKKKEQQDSEKSLEAAIFITASHPGDQKRKLVEKQSKQDVRNIILSSFDANEKKEILSEGEISPSIVKDGYYGVYISRTYGKRRLVRLMIHYGGQCQLASSYSEYIPESDLIKMENWKFAEAQEKVQSSFRCEELSSKFLGNFRDVKGWEQKDESFLPKSG